MPLSYSTYTGDGSQTSFSITFDYLSETVVTGASPAGILVYLDEVKQTSGYTINTTTVDFSVAPGSGVAVLILRSTPRAKSDRLIDFADATVLTEAQLDTSALQLLYIAQEAFEQSTSGGSATPTYLPYSASLTAWDAESQRVTRVANPTGITDAVNKGWADTYFMPFDYTALVWNAQRSGINAPMAGLADPAQNQQAATKKYVDDIAQWGIAGVPQAYKFTASGSSNTFTLTDAPYAEAEMLLVAIDGVIQVPTDDFTVTGGAANSILVLDVTPTSGQIISVQNFGKARFTDATTVGDGSITTTKLADDAVTTAKMADDAVTTAKITDANVTTAKLAYSGVTTAKVADANVTTAKLADDAVTADKIADDSVDLARLKNAPFTANNAESTVKVLRVDSNSANLTLGTLAAADISDFNSSVTAQPVSAFTQAQGNVSMGAAGGTQYKIVNVADPTSDQDAATKVYVDNALGSGNKGTLISDTTLASDASSFTVEGWFDDSKYLYYEMHCYGFSVTSNAAIGIRFKDSTGIYRNGSDDYRTGATGFGAQFFSPSRNALATPMLSNNFSSGLTYASFVLLLPDNSSAASFKKISISTGACAQLATGATDLHGDNSDQWKAVSTFLLGTGSASTIEGLRFVPITSDTATGTTGNIRAGARVLVYGYEGLS
jgi:hypothetical protein